MRVNKGGVVGAGGAGGSVGGSNLIYSYKFCVTSNSGCFIMLSVYAFTRGKTRTAPAVIVLDPGLISAICFLSHR